MKNSGPKSQTKAKNNVGLDIGTHAIKVVEISETAGKRVLAGVGSKRIIGVSKTEASVLIKSLIEESRISTKEVGISISGSSVIARFITMPKMEEEALRGAIQFEAEKYIPFNINDCVVDFQVLKKDDRENKISILLAAAKKESVLEKVKLAEEAGLSVTAVDVDSFALTNSFFANFSNLEPDKTTALLNIGATFTNLSILRGGVVYFVRDVAIGGNDFNGAISKKFGIDAKSAEQLKMAPKDKLQEVANCIKATLGNLLDDVKLSFSYHENQSGRAVDQIYVSGGSSNVIGLNEAFQEVFDSNPFFWNPFDFLNKPTGFDANLIEKTKDSFGVAVGIALKQG